MLEKGLTHFLNETETHFSRFDLISVIVLTWASHVKADCNICAVFRFKSFNTCSDFSNAFYLTVDILLGSGLGKYPSPALFPTLNQTLGFITQISSRLEGIFPAYFIRENSEYSRETLEQGGVLFQIIWWAKQSSTFHRIPIFKSFPCLQIEVFAQRNVF